jgi:hypothetical protein
VSPKAIDRYPALALGVADIGGGDFAVQSEHLLIGGKRAGGIAAVAFDVSNLLDDEGELIVADQGNDKGYTQVGIVSWGPQCGNPLFPGVYTRVSSFSDWIEQNIKGATSR